MFNWIIDTVSHLPALDDELASILRDYAAAICKKGISAFARTLTKGACELFGEEGVLQILNEVKNIAEFVGAAASEIVQNAGKFLELKELIEELCS